MENIETFITQDGSVGLYDKNLNEIFHSKFGAKKEAFEKFHVHTAFSKKIGQSKHDRIISMTRS